MKALDLIITLGSLNDSIRIIEQQLQKPDLEDATKDLLRLHHRNASVCQSDLYEMFKTKKYLTMKNKKVINNDSNIAEIDIANNEYTSQLISQSNLFLTEQAKVKSYGEFIKQSQQVRRVIAELITTEADFINACQKVGEAKNSLIAVIKSYANSIEEKHHSDALMVHYFEACIEALDSYHDVPNCFIMKYMEALKSVNKLENIIYWLNDHFFSTDYANYHEDKLKKMALSSDMLYQLIIHIKKTGNDNNFNLTDEQKQAINIIENEVSKPFQRVPRYALLIDAAQKSFEPLNKFQVFEMAENNNSNINNSNNKPLNNILIDLVTLAKTKAENFNQSSSLRHYAENLLLNAQTLLKELNNYIEQCSSAKPAFFKRNQLQKLELQAAKQLKPLVNKAIQQLAQPAVDSQAKLKLVEPMADFLRKSLRKNFENLNLYLMKHYTKEQKFEKVEDSSEFWKILTPYISRFQPLSEDDKRFLLEEWRMASQLEQLNQLYCNKNTSYKLK